jgi:hypothetical protein
MGGISYLGTGRGCRLVAVPAFKAVRGAIALSPVGSIPTPSASDVVTFTLRGHYCNITLIRREAKNRQRLSGLVAAAHS